MQRHDRSFARVLGPPTSSRPRGPYPRHRPNVAQPPSGLR